MLKPLVDINFAGVPIYFIMMLFGFAVAYLKLSGILKQQGFSEFMSKRVKRTFSFAAMIGLLCSNIANWFLFDGMLDRSFVFRITKGGFSFVFGLTAFLIISALLLLFQRVNASKAMHLIVEPILIAHFWGRIGCSLRGCCWGETLSIAEMEIMFPAREMEAVFLLIMLWAIPRVAKNKLWIYLISYSTFRFVLEFFRGDDRGSLFGITMFSPSQIVCIVLIVVSIIRLLVSPVLQKINLRDNSMFLPDGYEETVVTKKTVSIVAKVMCTLVTASFLFVVINPMNLAWCSNLQWKISDLFSFFTTDRSMQVEIGDGSGTSLIPIVQEEPVDLESGLEIITSIDKWSGAEYVSVGEETLANGEKLFSYMQNVQGRPVLGTTRTLIADKDSNSKYVISDPASQTYTSDIIEKYISNGITLEEAFEKKVMITDVMSCWYDTGYGLVAAKHVLFSYDGQEPVMGAVLQELDSSIICFTGPKLGVLSNSVKTELLLGIQEVLSKTLKEESVAYKMPRGSYFEDSFVLADSEIIDEIVNTIVDEYGLTSEQLNIILSSLRDKVESTENISLTKFGELFASTVQSMLEETGCTENVVLNAYKRVMSLVGRTDDEKAIRISAQPRENKFRYRIQYVLDADVFYISSQERHSLEITISTENPVQIEMYDMDGRAITSIYIDNQETIQLYPEDGTEFVLKVKGCKLNNKSIGSYHISVKTEEQKVEVPEIVKSILYRAEQSYNASDVTQFMSLYKEEGYSILEGMMMGTLVPYLDSCAPSSDATEDQDIAKETILRLILKGQTIWEVTGHLYNSEMSITYISHIEYENGYLVKARVNVTKDNSLVLSGITRFKLEPYGENDVPVEIIQSLEKIEGLEGFGLFIQSSYCITEVNTDEIFALFGDDPNNANIISEWKSLYAFMDNAVDTVTIEGKEIPIKIFDKKSAQEHGHSEEKIAYIEKYVARVNISSYKKVRDELQNEINSMRAAKTGYELLDFVMDPSGFVFESIADQNKCTGFIYDVYEFVKKPFDKIGDEFKDLVVEDYFDKYLEAADEMEEIVKKLDNKIKYLEKKLE